MLRGKFACVYFAFELRVHYNSDLHFFFNPRTVECSTLFSARHCMLAYLHVDMTTVMTGMLTKA